MKYLTFTGPGRLLENDEYVESGGRFAASDDRAVELLSDSTVAVELALDEHMTREELNNAARGAGIEKPEDLPNKQAVIDALVNQPESPHQDDEGLTIPKEDNPDV